MTNFTKNLLIAAAALTLTASVVSAQTLKAEIPFTFAVSGKVLTAGAYQINAASATKIVSVRGIETRDSALTVKGPSADPRPEWKADHQARLVFECDSSLCTLIKMYNGDDAVYNLSHPKSSAMGTRIAVIVMRPDKGD